MTSRRYTHTARSGRKGSDQTRGPYPANCSVCGERVVVSGPNMRAADFRVTDGVATAAHIDCLEGIDWLIVGGESGPKHRPIEADWVRELRDHALDNGTAFFFKQWGGRTPKANGRLLDGREWSEMPTGDA